MDSLDVESGKNAGSTLQHTKGKFKLIGHVVMAMKRFQASLNPTYQYGKRSSDGGPVEVVEPGSNRVTVQPKPAVGDIRSSSGRNSGRTTSGRTLSGRPTSAGQHHGYKGSLLFRPLPNPEPPAVKSG